MTERRLKAMRLHADWIGIVRAERHLEEISG
jgi:hypothetical protein